MTNEKMTENQELYARIGYVLFDRQTVHGYSRVLMRKPLKIMPTRPNHSLKRTARRRRWRAVRSRPVSLVR